MYCTEIAKLVLLHTKSEIELALIVWLLFKQ